MRRCRRARGRPERARRLTPRAAACSTPRPRAGRARARRGQRPRRRDQRRPRSMRPRGPAPRSSPRRRWSSPASRSPTSFRQLDAASVSCAGATAARCEPARRWPRSPGGPAAAPAERTALNFLQRLSGIATHAARFVDAAAGRIAVLDTRKTTPTFRALEKTRCAAAAAPTTDARRRILIKDNHKRLAGGSGRGPPGAGRRVGSRSRSRSRPSTSSTRRGGRRDPVLLDNFSTYDIRLGGRAVAAPGPD